MSFLLKVLLHALKVAGLAIAGSLVVAVAHYLFGLPSRACAWLSIAQGCALAWFFVFKRKNRW